MSRQTKLVTACVSLAALVGGAIYIAVPDVQTGSVASNTKEENEVFKGAQEKDSPLVLAVPSAPVSNIVPNPKSVARPDERSGDLAPSNAVLARLERIEGRLDVAEKAVTPVIANKVNADFFESGDQAVIDSVNRTQARVAQMRNAFIADRSTARSGNLVSPEREVLAAVGSINNSRVGMIECGETLCRIRATHKGEAAIPEFMFVMTDKLRLWGGGAESHIVARLPNGEVETESFIGREGHVLSPPPDGI